MKIPKYIKAKMHRVALLNIAADKEMEIVEEWLERKGLDTSTEGLRDGSGISLEELEFGNDITDELCERIENGMER